ncbi:ATP-binding protein [Flavobacterium adhaerens]|uniref:ATP-binding protein n=1 Tax=Flavobacterium adhaerens TaxID=3149043 RepID=UPI0032B45039
MMCFFRNIFLGLLLLSSFCIEAQNENLKTKISFQPVNNLKANEEKQIKSLYAIYNKGEEKLAYKKAHRLIQKAKYPKTISDANLLIAYYFQKQSSLDSTLFYTKRALQSNSNSNDSLRNRLVTLGYNLMASVYLRKGLLAESKKYRIKGMETALKYNEQQLYFNHKHGLALIYSQEGKYTKALQLFKDCLTYKEDPEMIYGSYINIGDIYAAQKNYELSNQYLKKAAALCDKEQNSYCTAIVAISLGANYMEQKQMDTALNYYLIALKTGDTNNYQQISLDSRVAIAQIHYNQGQYENAKLLLTAALEKTYILGLLQERINIYDQLTKIAVNQNNYKDALMLSDKRETLKDSINRIQNKKDIAELEIKFNTLQKEKEIRTLQFENETSQLKLKNQEEAILNLNLQKEVAKNLAQKKLSEIALLKKQKQLKALEIEQEKKTRNLIIIAFSFLFLLIIGSLFQYYKRLKAERILNKKQHEVTTQKLETILKEQELKLIKASVAGQDKERQRIAQELHDSIGGNLAAIKLQVNAISKNSNISYMQNITSQLDETYQQVRNLSHNLVPKKFSQNQFCLVIEDYLNSIKDVSKIIIESNFYPKEAINRLDETIQLEAFSIIQELLANTIKHAEATKIDLQLNLIENHLNLLFEDNGKGFNILDVKKGIGLHNLENRLKGLGGAMEIDSKIKRGTIVNIEIPILQSNEKINFEKDLYELTKNM